MLSLLSMKTDNTIYMKKIWLLAVVALFLLASCGKVDLGKLVTGKPYIGQYHGNDVVVVLDQVSDGDVFGYAYLDKGDIIADRIDFTSHVGHKGRGQLKCGEDEEKLKLSVGDESLRGTIGESDFVLHPYIADSVSFQSYYRYPRYKVFEEHDRVYASGVPGYWTSYPETGEGFGAIYMRRLPDLAFTKERDLEMDLYYPQEQSSVARPLLVLIHGGAFYNGDKGSAGFPEMGRHFAQRGYVVASINYRLGFRPTGQSIDRAGYRAVQDANAAVRFLINHAHEFQIDADYIFVGGTSAGAITALNLAFMREETRPEASRKIALGPDLGPIESVNPEIRLPFNIKAVVNMWGAVHDLSMLVSSKKTSVLSFHGDQDPIVPYDYGCPFHDMVSPLVEDVFRPMYGSKPITEKMASLGARAELHTCHGGGHSLHVDEDGQLSEYFEDTILPNMTRFLCEEMAGGTIVNLVRAEPTGRVFEAQGVDNVTELHWQVEGGVVAAQQGHKMRALFFSDAPKHSVTVSGKYKNGMEFREKFNGK